MKYRRASGPYSARKSPTYSTVFREVENFDPDIVRYSLETISVGSASVPNALGVPPRVEYEITGLGRSLLRPTQGLVDWAKANWEQVREAQSKYDAR